MNPRLRKEIHLIRMPILVSWGIQAGLILFERAHTGVRGARGAINGYDALIPFVIWITAAYLGVLPFSHEFDNQTLTSRLLEPRRREGIWWSKIGSGFLSLFLFQMGALLLCRWAGITDDAQSTAFMSFFAVTAWLSGPACALITGNTATATALCILGQMLSMLSAVLYLQLELQAGGDLTVICKVGAGFGILGLAWSRWKWMRWELRSEPRNGQARWARLLSSASQTAFPRQAPIGRHLELLRRELLLQTRTLGIGVSLCLLAALDRLLMEHSQMREVAQSILPGLLLLPSAVVSLLAGYTLGTERSLGVDFLSSTQPISSARIFRTKLIVGGGIAILLGILLPWMFSNAMHLYATHSANDDLLLMSGTCALFFCLAWFGSVLGKDARRAMLLSACLPAVVIGATSQVYSWVTPWLASQFGSTTADIGFLESAGWLFGRTPFSQHSDLVRTGMHAVGLLCFCALCLFWIRKYGRLHHVPRSKPMVAFGGWLLILMMVNTGVGVWSILSPFLQGP